MKLTQRYALLSGFALALILLVSVEWLSWRHSTRAVEIAAMLTSSHRVRDDLGRLLAQILELDAWQRTNLPADELPSLQPLDDGLNSIEEQQSALERLIIHPEQKANVVALGPLLAEWSVLVRRNVELRRNSGAEAVRQEILTGRASVLLGQIKAQLARMDARGHAFVTERSVVAGEEARNARLLTAAGIGLTFALLIALFGLVLRENRLRQRTERKAAKESLDRERNLLRVLIDNLPACIYVKDLEGRILVYNSASVRQVGLNSEAEALGKTVSDFFPPEIARLYEADDNQVYISGQTIKDREEPTQDRDGNPLWYLTTKLPLRDANGVIGLLGISQDITERKRIEQALRESGEYFRFLNDLVEATRTLTDPERIMAVMARMLGEHLRASRCAYANVEKNGEQFTILHDYTDGCASTVGNYRLSLFGGRAVDTLNRGQTLIIRNVEAELLPGEGADMFNAIGIKAIITCPLVKNGGLRAMMAVHQTTPRDWTTNEISMVEDVVERCWATIERRVAEEEVQQLNVELERRVIERTAQLEEANKELEAFSYSVSHDLRAPLRAVDGFSHAVLEDFGPQLGPEGKRQLQTISDCAQRMGVLIDDLLAFSRLNRQELKKRAIDTGQLVRSTLDELGLPWPERQIEIRFGDLPSTSGDPALLRQVWLNLLSNALKYTSKREKAVVEIGCTSINGAEAFFVRDNGTGFDMRYAEKLFGVFQRLHRLEEFEGTGVGLAIVQRIVHRHGGRVWADATVDGGATFYFTIEEESTA